MDKNLYESLQQYMDIAYEQKKLKNSYSYNEQFSFFMTIADQYRKENFHSDILKVILDPKTTEIGNTEHLQNFLEIIGLKKNSFGNESSIKKYVQVEREEHRVDLLIKYNNPRSKKAIIVENKINNADDQDNQLARYYEILTEEGYEVLSIPYITKFGGKTPDYNSWDKRYQKYVDVIFNDKDHLFFDLPVVGGKKSILEFLNQCHKQENNNLALLFLEQYQLLLKKIVEDSEVTKEDEKNIQQLFEDDQKSKIQALIESWDLRGTCAYNYIKSKCNGKDCITISTIYGAECLVIKNNNTYYEGVYLYPNGSTIQIGFYRKENNWKPKISKEAFEYVKDICKQFLKKEIDNSNIIVLKNWYCLNIEIDQFDTFEKINSNFRKALIQLSNFKS